MFVKTYIHVVGAAVMFGGIASAQDLNNNAQEDSRDLRLATSEDCNLNGVVDERDAVAPHFTQAIEHLNALEGEQFQNNVWDMKPIDFNQDGLQDLVVTSMYETNTGAITFWRNEGGAGLVYLTRMLIPNTRPYSLRVADLNGDGMDDFAASDASYNRAYVYLATGVETFATPQTLVGPAANNGSVGLDIGDLDQDGDIDIAFSTWYPAMITTFLNDGSGQFAFGVSFATGLEPRDIAIGDIDGDKLPDIAAANQFYTDPFSAGTVSIHVNNGDGTFTLDASIPMPNGVPPYNYKARPQFVDLADVSGDGALDLLTSSQDSNVLTIHQNDSDGNFALAQSIGGWWLESNAQDVLVTDLDGDAVPELLWGDDDMHRVSIYKSVEGSYELHQSYASTTYGGFTLAAVDLSGDGLPEIVSSNNPLRSFCVMENQGALVFDATIQLRKSEFPAKALLADFTNDGITDLFNVKQPYISGPYYLSVYPGLGGALFSNESIDTELTLTSGTMFVRDVNDDGLPDLLDVTGHCYVYLGLGDGTFAPAITSPITPRGNRLAIGDINVDGDLDLAWVIGSHPSILHVSFGDGAGNFGPSTSYTDVAEDESVGIGDITGDGAPEIFTGHRLGIFSIHPNLGDGTFGTRRDITIQGTPFLPTIAAIAVADFDGDADNDVVVSANGLDMFFNPGDGELPEIPDDAATLGASELFATDIDLDGTIDLYGEASTVIVYLNTAGTGFFEIEMKLRHYDSNARQIVVADANDDGRMDVMLSPENSWSNYLFLNLPPADTDVNGDSQLDSCVPFFLGDFDGDQTVDEDDRAIFCAAMGATQDDPNYVLAADFDMSGMIDQFDLQAFNEVLPLCGGDVVSSATFAPPADGMTDAADLAYLLGAWGNEPSCADFVFSGSFAPPPDGHVDAADLAYLLGEWGSCGD